MHDSTGSRYRQLLSFMVLESLHEVVIDVPNQECRVTTT